MGKTKDVVRHSDGTCTFTFKDDACGENGQFDPGANGVGLTIEGMGRASLLLSVHFFPIMEKAGIPIAYLQADPEKRTMLCKTLSMLPFEFVFRQKAWGSFCKRYGTERGFSFGEGGLVEATLKTDALGDPLINQEACVKLGKITAEQYELCEKYTRLAAKTVAAELTKFGYELIDVKFEFGVDAEGQVRMGDEISGGIWRILDENGTVVDPLDCAKKICAEM